MSCRHTGRAGLRRRVLSVRQPWASLLVWGWKDCENRTWPTDYRGPLLIHASKRLDQAELRAARVACARAGYVADGRAAVRVGDFPLGAIIGLVCLAKCLPPQMLAGTQADLYAGRTSPWRDPLQYGWYVSGGRCCEPIPIRGHLGLWTYDGPAPEWLP